MSRGNQRDDIFLDDVDRHDFVKTLAEACQKLVEGSGSGYLRTACDYVHLNPVRAKLLAPDVFSKDAAPQRI